MNIQLIIGLILTILPITELRVGLPIVLDYCIKNNLPIIPFFILVLTLNILIIFVIFFFLDFLHHRLLKLNSYKKIINLPLKKIQRKTAKFEKKFKEIGFLALIFFVAIPLPGTGAWTGTLLAWTLNLKRKQSILAISIGVIIAGLIIFLTSLGLISAFS